MILNMIYKYIYIYIYIYHIVSDIYIYIYIYQKLYIYHNIFGMYIYIYIYIYQPFLNHLADQSYQRKTQRTFSAVTDFFRGLESSGDQFEGLETFSSIFKYTEDDIESHRNTQNIHIKPETHQIH